MGQNKQRLNISSIITAILVYTVVGYVFISCWKGLNRTYIEEEWQSHPGTVLSQELELEGKKNIERKTAGLEQIINYEYTVAEKTYRSNSVSKEEFVLPQNYPEGKQVDVWVNPSDPTDSVLIRSKVQKPYLYTTMFFCLLIFGVVTFALIRDLRRS